LYADDWGNELPGAITHPEQNASFRRLWEAVRETDGPILSENLAALVLHEKPVLVEPFGFLVLTRAHLLRTRPVVRDCERQFFRLIVVEGLLERVPSLRECFESRYYVAEEIPPYRLLRPRPGGSTSGLSSSLREHSLEVHVAAADHHAH